MDASTEMSIGGGRPLAAIKGKMVTLNVSSAQDERLLNRETTSTIESFKTSEIVVKSSVGETSTFRRLL